MCCDPDSNLSALVPSHCVAIRCTKATDITNDETLRVFLHIMGVANKRGIRIHIWASIPCTAGCPWEYVNASKGISTGDPEATITMIQNVGALCQQAVAFNGDFTHLGVV